MPAVRKIHAQDGVARLDDGKVDAHVGLASRVGLDVRVVGAEKGLRPVAGQVFGHVDELTAAVIASTRITLGVLVRENGASSLHHGAGAIVFAGDKLQIVALSRGFEPHRFEKLGIFLLNKGHQGLLSGVAGWKDAA